MVVDPVVVAGPEEDRDTSPEHPGMSDDDDDEEGMSDEDEEEDDDDEDGCGC